MSGPDWDIDRGWGEEGQDVVKALSRYNIEVKRKRRLDDKIYVELEQDPGATGTRWKPSGLRTTQAEYWAFVVGETGVVMFFPAGLLRWAIYERQGGVDIAEIDGDNPTRGRLLRVPWLVQVSGEWLAMVGRL